MTGEAARLRTSSLIARTARQNADRRSSTIECRRDMLGSNRDRYPYARDKADGSRDMRAKVLLGVWTPKLAGEELVEAVRWANKAAGAVGPSSRTGFFPEVALSADERALEEWPALDELDPPSPRRPHVTPSRVSQFERIIWWPARYLRDLPGPARVLHVWVRCKLSKRAKFDEACDRMGWARATAYRARDKALVAISMGLTADGIKRNEH